ncbi:hypothetical protein QOT17_021431 [Balamuthia mandrillaris]
MWPLQCAMRIENLVTKADFCPEPLEIVGHRYFGRELCIAAIRELFPKQKHERAEVPLLQQQLEAFVALESGSYKSPAIGS